MRPDCKQCVKSRSKVYRETTGHDKKRYWDNRDSELARNKEYHARTKAAKLPRVLKTPEEYAKYKHEWYLAHRDETLARTKKRYRENVDEIKVQSKARREKDRVKIRIAKSAYKAKRRAQIKENGGTFTVADVKLQYKSQKGRCWWCNKEVGDKYHIDHLTPLSRGGSNSPNNIVIACETCNLSRNNKMPHEWNGKLL